MDTSGTQLELFQGRGGFVESGHFDEYFVNKHNKKRPRRENLGVFSLDTLKTIPWIEDLTQRWIKSGLFFFLRWNSVKIYTEWKLLSIRDLPNFTLYFMYLPLHKIPQFHLISWCGNFVKTHSFYRVSEICSKLCGNCAFPQTFHTRKLD